MSNDSSSSIYVANMDTTVTLASRVFGVPMEMVAERENSQVPLIIHKCIEAVEEYGMLGIC